MWVYLGNQHYRRFNLLFYSINELIYESGNG